jgi:hypothetical protein
LGDRAAATIPEVGADEPVRAAELTAAEGAAVIRGMADPDLTAALRAELEACVLADDLRFGATHPFPGMVHVLAARHGVFLEFLKLPALRPALRALLGHGCIVHAHNSSSVPPRATNYARDIHVDAPRWIDGYITNATCILALDPFDGETGGMEIMPDSFRRPEKPDLKTFEAAFVRPMLAPGDALMFNPRSWHRAGMNRTSRWRHGVTVNSCRAFMRQQFDFPRLLEAAGVVIEDEDLRQFLGWHVRMPTSLDEFLLPPDRRPYRPGQE